MATPATAAGAGSEPKVDLLNIEWRFQEWLIGMGGLNPDNVLDYFALSPFWDPECNNAVLRMQTQFNNLGEMKQRLSLYHVQRAFNEARTSAEFHPSAGYHWNVEESLLTSLAAATPAVAPAAAASSSHKPESMEFREALSRAFKSTETRLRDQKEQIAGTMGATQGVVNGAAGGAGTKVKAEPGTPSAASGGATTPGGKSTTTTKATTKRRKKNEDPSIAGASNIYTSVTMTGQGQGGRAQSSGGGPGTPATPTAATPTKRRKKTKAAADAK
ncbi:Mediator of RNA polymerase II transcription subunit 6 [Podila humilis]|nr:Mediator of RNA polymerase II transcription subunit 6 [Podila humilis]